MLSPKVCNKNRARGRDTRFSAFKFYSSTSFTQPFTGQSWCKFLIYGGGSSTSSAPLSNKLLIWAFSEGAMHRFPIRVFSHQYTLRQRLSPNKLCVRNAEPKRWVKLSRANSFSMLRRIVCEESALKRIYETRVQRRNTVSRTCEVRHVLATRLGLLHVNRRTDYGENYSIRDSSKILPK